MLENPSFFKRPWVWAVLVTLLSVGGMLAAYLSRQVGDEDWWRREAGAYNARHAVPDAENAALFYKSLGRPTKSLVWTRNWIREDWGLPTETSDLPLLDGQEPLLAAFAQAAALPSCFYPFDPTAKNPYKYTLSYLNRIMPASQLLVLEARRLSGERHPEEAALALLAAARIGFHHDRGYLDSECVGIACRGFAFEGLEHLAMDAPPDPATLESLASELQKQASRRPSLAEFWEGERLVDRGTLERLYRPGLTLDMLEGSTPTSAPSTLSVIGGSLGWGVIALRFPLRRCRDEFDEVYDTLSKDTRSSAEMARIQQITSDPSFFTGLLLPSIATVEAGRLKDITLERQTRILLLLKAYRLRHGAYPASLEILKGSTAVEIPEDPYTDKPFIYEVDGDGFQLSSKAKISGTLPKTPGSARGPAGSGR